VRLFRSGACPYGVSDEDEERINGEKLGMPTSRRTVDLSGYPDLVVVYLGMRVNVVAGLLTLLGFGPKIESSARARPPGLLHHEVFLFSLFPPHAGIRQYWQDFESLERWARSEPHRSWWKSFLRDSQGTGFWHETYRMQGGIEAIYDDVPKPIGMLAFAPVTRAKGGMFSARRRIAATKADTGFIDKEELEPAVAESELRD
jgi:hypothetical protein